MRLCIVCKKRITANMDAICDVCRGNAGYNIEGYAYQIASKEALIKAQKEESKHQSSYLWVKKDVFRNNV